MNPLLKQAFEQAAVDNYWSDADSLSGPGSNMIQTKVIREAIPMLLEEYSVKSMLDAPCGDLFWMRTVLPELMQKGIQYHGADIVPSLIEKHKIMYSGPNVFFHNIDLTKGPIPAVDLVFTRDCFIHLSYYNIYKILRNYKLSGAKYLLVNTYTRPSRKNYNVDGFYLWGRMLNMEKFPFYFEKPMKLIIEGCTENEGINDDKSLGLWKLEEINLLRIKLNLALLYFPGLFMRWFKNFSAFATRLKNFIRRKISK